MPRYAASISEMLTMPVGVLTTDYIDVWCNTATDTAERWQRMSRWWRYVSRRCRVVSHGVLPRLVVDVCGMRRGDVSRDLSRSVLRRECGLAARHLVRVFVVTDILHIE